MGELAGRTGSANPALQGLRVRGPCASVRPCVSVRVRALLCPCARVSACPACSQEGRAGSRRPGVARVSAAGGGVPGAPPLRAAPFPGLRGWPLRRAAAESAPRPPSRAAQGAGGGAPPLVPRGTFCRPLFPSAVREQSASTVGFWEITDKCGLNGFGFCFFLRELANI